MASKEAQVHPYTIGSGDWTCISHASSLHNVYRFFTLSWNTSGQDTTTPTAHSLYSWVPVLHGIDKGRIQVEIEIL